jgi:hypothetical protein
MYLPYSTSPTVRRLAISTPYYLCYGWLAGWAGLADQFTTFIGSKGLLYLYLSFLYGGSQPALCGAPLGLYYVAGFLLRALFLSTLR